MKNWLFSYSGSKGSNMYFSNVLRQKLSVSLGPDVVKQEKNIWPEIFFDAVQGDYQGVGCFHGQCWENGVWSKILDFLRFKKEIINHKQSI